MFLQMGPARQRPRDLSPAKHRGWLLPSP